MTEPPAAPQPDQVSPAPPRAPRPAHGETLRLLIALAFAILGGLLARRLGAPGLHAARGIAQLGQLWLNALRMTLVPLVFCLMATGVASLTRSASGGAVARTALAVFLALLVAGSIVGTLAAIGLLHLWPIAALHAATSTGAAPASPSLLAEFVSLVPANPIASAAEGVMAPLIVFAAVFGAAIVRLKPQRADLLLETLSAIAAAMLVIVGWVLRFAPAGIFCLLFGTVATVGAEAAKGLLHFAVFASLVPLLGILLAELLGMASGVGPRTFARSCLPAQTLAATTQSSTACLPALLEAASALGLPQSVVAAIMPMAVATFRFGNVTAAVATGLFAANLFGVHPRPGQIVTAICIGLLTNVGSAGLPGAAVLLAAWGPVFLALGAPLEGLTLYIAVITAPDILITTCNVTGDLAATSLIATLVARRPQRAA